MTGYESKKAMAQDKITDEQGRPMTYWGGKAQPAQEPVAWITPDGEGFRIRFSPPTNDVPLGWDALYASPPQRTWVGLTEKEKKEIYRLSVYVEGAISLTEAKLKEKNNGT